MIRVLELAWRIGRNMSDNQEEYVSRNQYRLVRGRINQLIDEEPSAKQMVLGMECILQKLSQMKQKKLSK